MVKFLAHVAVSLLSSALSLLLAAWLLPGVMLRPSGFVVAVSILVICQAIFAPLAFSFARKYAQGLFGGIGIASTLLALIIAVLVPDGIEIHDATAWIVTPLLVWFVTGFGGWIVTVLIIDRLLDRRKETKAIQRAEKARARK